MLGEERVRADVVNPLRRRQRGALAYGFPLKSSQQAAQLAAWLAALLAGREGERQGHGEQEEQVKCPQELLCDGGERMVPSGVFDLLMGVLF